MIKGEDLKNQSLESLQETLTILELQLKIVQTQEKLNSYAPINQVRLKMLCPICQHEHDHYTSGQYFESGRY